MRVAKQKAWRPAGLPGVVAVLLLATGCANDRGPHPDLPRIGLYSTFTSRNLCGLGVSPEVRLITAPADTAVYRVKMTNVSALSGPSWEFDIPAAAMFNRNGETVLPEAAIPDFPAPCVPENIIQQYFNYRVEVMAMGKDNRPLAYGWGFAVAYSLTRQLGFERAQALIRQREDAAAAREAALRDAENAASRQSQQQPAQPAPQTTPAGSPSQRQQDVSQPAVNQPPVASAPLQTTAFPMSFGSTPPGPQPQVGPPIIRPFAPYAPQVTSYFFTY